ncbi:aminobenzoyl-glutamate transport protein [Gammaproteobacteria bacterium]|nr:aminobenzoyl-glutamate transport protein [Gammaproteobacteria bacterium]
MQKVKQHRFMDTLEHLGDKLPHPFYIFIYLCIGVLLFSALLSGNSVLHPSSGQEVLVKNLLSSQGLIYILESAVNNFIGFKPLGLVLCMMLAVGLLQESGLADAAIKAALLNAPKRFVTASIFFVGIIGNLASDAAFIIIPPLAGIIFAATHRHPVVGIAAGFVAVAAGFTANIFIAGTDVLLSGITSEATSVVKAMTISPTANWYFMLVSVPLLVIVGTLVTDYLVEPRFLRRYPLKDLINSDANLNDNKRQYQVSLQQKTALKWTSITAILYIGLILLLVLPASSPLKNSTGDLSHSHFLKGIIPIIMMFFIACAIVFGVCDKVITKPDDVPLLIAKSLRTVGNYIVLVFVIAQFIEWFKWSNLAIYIAVESAQWLTSLSLPTILMLIIFIFLTGILNLIVYSGSAQWAIMAPIFIPLFMLLDISPEVIQMAYRIGDSTTNIIAPTNPYIPMILALMVKYQPNIKFGTLMTMMLPYLISLLFSWTVLFLIYYQLGFPLGSGISAL